MDIGAVTNASSLAPRDFHLFTVSVLGLLDFSNGVSFFESGVVLGFFLVVLQYGERIKLGCLAYSIISHITFTIRKPIRRA